MSTWKIIEKHRDVLTDAAMNIASLGTYGFAGNKTYRYVLEHVETGETKRLSAENEYELGDLIADGDFDDE